MTALSPLRAGRITGSRIGKILGESTYGTRQTVMREMVRQVHGAPDEVVVTDAMKYGTDHEADAVAAYEAYRGVQTHSAQLFVIHPEFDFLGVSPDGLVGDDGGVEAKCPSWTTYSHINQRPDYKAQILLSLACTGREWWDFAVWRENEPIAVSRVEQDPWWLESVLPRLLDFIAEYEAIVADPERAAPYLEPLVNVRSDSDWQMAETEYLEWLALQKAAETGVADAKARLLELADGKSSKGAGVSVSYSERKGTIDWQAVGQNYPDVPVDEFRKPSTTVATVRQVTS